MKLSEKGGALGRRLRRLALPLMAVGFVTALAAPVMAAPPVRIVHSFDGTDGRSPSDETLVRGPLGTVFGVTMLGGERDEGALFFVDANDRFHLVHSFAAGTGGGWMPNAVFFSEGGKLFGTTAFGGAYEQGTVYQLAWNGDVSTIHSFDGVDGNQPSGRVVVRNGFFYGSTGSGGAAGNVYRLSPAGDISVLYEVPQRFSNEAGVYSGLGGGLGEELFGATYGWDVGDFHGVIFKIDASGVTSTIHTFQGGSDGSRATSPPVVMADGTVYGTTLVGGAYGGGVIYKVTPEGDYSVAYSFGGEPNAFAPFGGLVLGTNGNLYGTTTAGGEANNGTIFEFKTSGEFRVIYSFSGVNNFGYPQGGLVETTPGTFYGMTGSGGDFGLGTIYKLRLR